MLLRTQWQQQCTPHSVAALLVLSCLLNLDVSWLCGSNGTHPAPTSTPLHKPIIPIVDKDFHWSCFMSLISLDLNYIKRYNQKIFHHASTSSYCVLGAIIIIMLSTCQLVRHRC